nr:amidohydrolase family protein [Amycolatopsis sp. FDAARGOS 1241]
MSGVLDRHPDLQFILGHWGEFIPFYLDRLDEALPARLTRLDCTFREHLRHNVFITSSGMFSPAQLRYSVDTVGADRILYSADFPLIGNEGAAAFPTEAERSEEDRAKIAHGNAEELLGLS